MRESNHYHFRSCVQVGALLEQSAVSLGAGRVDLSTAWHGMAWDLPTSTSTSTHTVDEKANADTLPNRTAERDGWWCGQLDRTYV